MSTSRRRSSQPPRKPSTTPPSMQSQTSGASSEPAQPEPTGKVFLGEEDKRLLKKFNEHIVNKLGLGGNRSIKL
jgi:hypothetical protein